MAITKMKNIPQYSYSKSEDFIQTWHIPEGICDAIVDFYHANKQYHAPGVCKNQTEGGATEQKHYKESTDISIAAGNTNQPFLDYRIELQKCLDEYVKIYPMVDHLHRFDIVEDYNIQFYKKGQGFKVEHFERDGGLNNTARRCLVFMTYLNDLDDGGTIFTYQKRTVKAQKCKTVIFPTDWTHTHVGQISHTQEKMIVTGWYSYKWDI